MFSPTLETERLVLRNLAAQDLSFVLAHFGDPEVHRHLVDTEPVETEDGAQEIIDFYSHPERLERNRWVLVEKASEERVGTVGLHAYDRHNRKIEVGYDLSPTRWGKGLMREALDVVIEHSFATLGVHRIEAFVHTDNTRSVRLLERIGFLRDGTIRAQYWRNNAWHDHHVYSLLSTDRRAGE